VLTSLSKFESQTQILNFHSQSIAKLEVQLGQLAKSFNEKEIGKCSSQPITNPRSGEIVINPKLEVQLGINKTVKSNLFLLFDLCFEYRMFFFA
jgi:hypothetical protein